MRKADYAALADILKRERSDAGTKARDFSERVQMDAMAERIARDFAARASVDRAAFLKACGIE